MSEDEQAGMVVDEEELFGTTQPIAPLSPLPLQETSDGPRQTDLLADVQVGEQSDTEAKKDTGKVKKVRKPRVALNEERLVGKNGIRKLPDLFKAVKFKGKGYEKDDLNLLLREIEHWAHNMIPKQQFTDVVDKLELLGAKKIVRLHAQDVQRGIPILDKDGVILDAVDSDDGGRNGNENTEETSPTKYAERTHSEPLEEINALLNEDFGDINFE